MCRAVLAAAATCLLAAAPAAEGRGWMPATLWIECAADPSACVPVSVGQEIVLAVVQEQGNVASVSGAVFGLDFLNVELIELVPVNGFTNQGTMTSPVLVPAPGEDCHGIPFRRSLAEIRVRLLDPTAFRVCFVPSDPQGVSCSVLCPEGAYVQNGLAGYRYGSLPDCSDGGGLIPCLDALPVDPATWGRTKSAYRE